MPPSCARKRNTLDDKDERYVRTSEFLDIVRLEGTQRKTFDYAGNHYKVEKGFSQVKPYHPGGIYTFVGGGSDAAIEVAAETRRILLRLRANLTQAGARRHRALGRKPATKSGRPCPRFSLSVRPILADTEEKARL